MTVTFRRLDALARLPLLLRRLHDARANVRRHRGQRAIERALALEVGVDRVRHGDARVDDSGATLRDAARGHGVSTTRDGGARGMDARARGACVVRDGGGGGGGGGDGGEGESRRRWAPMGVERARVVVFVVVVVVVVVVEASARGKRGG